MTTRKNSRAARARAATPGAVDLAGGSRRALMDRLRQMADDVEHLQSEIAAVEAFVTEPTPVPATPTPTRHAARPGADWIPTPTPQPWLVARSA